MTLVLALSCHDAVVMASDGQLTSDAAGQPTRAPSRKLFRAGTELAWGIAGSTGLRQTVQAELADLDITGMRAELRRRALAEVVIPIQLQAARMHVALPGTEPPELACLFCWVDEGGPRILTIPRTGADHQFHEHFAAIGSGDIFAASTVRSVAPLGGQALSVEQAKMVAYSAVADAIDVAAVFLGPPIQMMVVTAAGAIEVPREELDTALADSVEVWRARRREALAPLAAPERSLTALPSTREVAGG